MQQPKGTLIERCKQLGLGKPTFSTRNTGPEHEPTFVSEVRVGGEVYGVGHGSNKREAERRASAAALEALAGRDGTGDGATPLSRGSALPPADTDTETGAEPFEGPWPIFPEVLASSLAVANSRVNPKLSGQEAIQEVQALALALYRGSLEALGEVVEEEVQEVLSSEP